MKIALIENFGSDFYGARLRYALFLQSKGHEVIAVVPNDGFIDKISEKGIRTISIDIDIRKRNLKTMYSYARKLRRVFKEEKFDVIHLYRMQPNILGSPMAYFASKRSKLINHITGLGVAFTKSSLKYRCIQFIIKNAYKINSSIFKASLIFQNYEDKVEIGNSCKFFVIKGSAVNEDRFFPRSEKNADILLELGNKYGIDNGLTLIFVSRLLKQKGLSYLIESVKRYNAKNNSKKVNLLIAGWLDENNPDSFSQSDIDKFSEIDRIVFLGKRNDIDQLIGISDIAVLPTYYREGTPRFLLEAMAMGKAIITTDMPGCNHLIKNGSNGVLVKIKDVEGLVAAIEYLSERDIRSLGQESREIYLNEFSESVVYNQLLASYLD